MSDSGSITHLAYKENHTREPSEGRVYRVQVGTEIFNPRSFSPVLLLLQR